MLSSSGIGGGGETTCNDDSGGGGDKCVICQCSVVPSVVVVKTETPTPLPPQLEKDIHVYFILKHVFELPSEQLEDFLRRSTYPPAEWLKICSICSETYVGKCKRLFMELMEVKRRFSEARVELVEAIKTTVELEALTGSGDCGGDEGFGVRKEIFRFVRNMKLNQSDEVIEPSPLAEHFYDDEDHFDDVDTMTSEAPIVAVTSENVKEPGPSCAKNVLIEGKTVAGKTLRPRRNINRKKKVTSTSRSPRIAKQSETTDGRKPYFYGNNNDDKTIDGDWDPGDDNLSEESSDDEGRTIRVLEDLDSGTTKANKPQLKSVKCDQCGQMLSSEARLRQHQITIHKTNLYECTECEFKADDKTKLSRHLKRNHNIKLELQERTCFICNQVFSSKSKVSRHIYRRHNDQREKFKCDQCSKEFLNEISYLNHLGAVHGVKEQLRYHCSFQDCDKSFYYRTQLENHEDTHRPEKLKCHLCPHKFSTRKLLQSHIKIRHELGILGLRPFACELCPAKLRTSSNLKYHMKQCHDPDTVPKRKRREPINAKCSECDGDFPHYKGLQRHMAEVHEKVVTIKELRGDESTQCPICGVVLKDKQSLSIHIDGVHEKKRQACCDICGKLITNRSNMNKHKYLAHKIGHRVKIPCTVEGCERTFNIKSDMKKHILIYHERQRPYQCNLCGKRFATTSHVNRHTQAVHLNSETKPFRCEECGRAFALNEYLLQHYRAQHPYLLPTTIKPVQ